MGAKISELQKQCELGNRKACLNLALMYEDGEGVKQDYQKAKEFYERACELGESLGYYNLGLMYEQGKGVEQNYQKATKIYKKACELGDQQACENYQRCLKELEENQEQRS